MNNDFDLMNDDEFILTSPLKDLSDELLEECIKSQIDNPFTSKVDFLEQFYEEYVNETSDLDTDTDEYRDNNTLAWNFYHKIFDLINNKFGLEANQDAIDGLNLEGIRNIAEGFYTFFILNYEKNITTYLIQYIKENQDLFIESIKQRDDFQEDNVSYASLAKKLSNPDYAILFSNINSIVNTIGTTEISPEDFIKYFNPDRFDVAIVKHCITNFIITGDFVLNFLGVLFNRVQNDAYDEIIGDIQHFFYKRFKKENPIGIDFLNEDELANNSGDANENNKGDND